MSVQDLYGPHIGATFRLSLQYQYDSREVSNILFKSLGGNQEFKIENNNYWLIGFRCSNTSGSNYQSPAKAKCDNTS